MHSFRNLHHDFWINILCFLFYVFQLRDNDKNVFIQPVSLITDSLSSSFVFKRKKYLSKLSEGRYDFHIKQ